MPIESSGSAAALNGKGAPVRAAGAHEKHATTKIEHHEADRQADEPRERAARGEVPPSARR